MCDTGAGMMRANARQRCLGLDGDLKGCSVGPSSF